MFASQGQSTLTSFHHCVELRFSHAQSCQTLSCGSRFHCMIPCLRRQYRRTVSRDRVVSEIAVHEDCHFVNVFLSSKSYCSFEFPNKIPCCTLQWNEVEKFLAVHLFSGPNASLFLQSLTCLGPNTKVSCKQICIVLPLSSELDSFF